MNKELGDSNINEIDILKEKNQMEIINYLNNSYCGAKMMGDDETMLRIARALAAFKADPYDNEVFQKKFVEKYILDDFSEKELG